MKILPGARVTIDGVRYELQKLISRDYDTGVNIWIAKRLDTMEAEYVEVK